MRDKMSFRIQIKNIDWSLFAIIDHEWVRGRDIQWIAEQLIQGGAGIIQYRNKVSEALECYQESKKIRVIAQTHRIPFIVNDRVDVALAVDADGVHLGKNDLPLSVARKLMGKHKIIGFSVQSHGDFQNAKNADYLGIGAIYPTKTKKGYPLVKLELIQEIRIHSSIPIVGIGGITVENLVPVIQSGADGIAVISALLGAQNIKDSAFKLVQAVKKTR